MKFDLSAIVLAMIKFQSTVPPTVLRRSFVQISFLDIAFAMIKYHLTVRLHVFDEVVCATDIGLTG